MKEIAERLVEKRQIGLAKRILESNGYKVRKLKESYSIESDEEMPGNQYKKLLLDDEDSSEEYIHDLEKLGVFSPSTKVYLDAMFDEYDRGSVISTSDEYNNRLFNITLPDGTPAILDTNMDGYDCCYILRNK